MAKNIIGNKDGKKGGNDSYRIPGRGNVPRTTVVREVKVGKHPLHTITRINDEEYIKAKPDNSEINNVNR